MGAQSKIIQETHVSHDQIRIITAEMVDTELLHYIGVSGMYITTDKGYKFLNRRQQSNTFRNSPKVFDKKPETKQKKEDY